MERIAALPRCVTNGISHILTQTFVLRVTEGLLFELPKGIKKRRVLTHPFFQIEQVDTDGVGVSQSDDNVSQNLLIAFRVPEIFQITPRPLRVFRVIGIPRGLFDGGFKSGQVIGDTASST